MTFVVVSITTGLILNFLDFIFFANRWSARRMRLYGAMESLRENARTKWAILFNLVNGFIFAYVFYLMQAFSDFVLLNGLVVATVLWLVGALHPAFSDIVMSHKSVKLIVFVAGLGIIKYAIAGIVIALLWHFWPFD